MIVSLHLVSFVNRARHIICALLGCFELDHNCFTFYRWFLVSREEGTGVGKGFHYLRWRGLQTSF